MARNREYAALKKFAQVMHFDGVPGLELPDIDITGIATATEYPQLRSPASPSSQPQ